MSTSLYIPWLCQLFVSSLPTSSCLELLLHAVDVFRTFGIVQNDKNYFSIYVKLSTLTGITCMVLFHSVVFNYIYIALICTQGIYVMIVFTCNKRIFKLYFGRYDVKGSA